MGILSKIFTWWDGATIGTLLFSARHGVHVGEDEAGNKYYQAKKGNRRWVIYNGSNDASRVSPMWHGWLHGSIDDLPDHILPVKRDWQKLPTGNLTGSTQGYRPKGALEHHGKRAAATGDYEAWSPEG
ncbi:NADH:ubiquinone oxidoreductase subunit NDUFA12 [Sphingorhabdus lutea]|uniref:NADH:ubiquinone oxidoreductase subunit NDUFA12 n=1 Tax=Sphingorhabdus lutea TaxID=1913578 RepID=A0A1L3JE26_9SPHN|nr:NADH:ubiquinone oxidoreductase subunit NDUFA12 [Sphingorhabdus lutea]APG63303.1 NADH:ubiquinone oxidoreductase subunit NDUFA12 [Sphingorhabdus lutea]